MQSRALNYLWKFALTGIALLIFVMAIRALINLTRTISWADIVTAMSQIPNTHLVLAFLVVAFGYIVLTLYDTIALMQLGISVVNALSTKVEVTVWRDGQTYSMQFADGEPVAPLAVTPSQNKRKRGTRVQFWVDARYFDSAKFNTKALKQNLKAKAVLAAGLSVQFINQIDGDNETWQFSDGLAQYLSEQLADTETTPTPPYVFGYQAKADERASLDVALCWLIEGGTPVQESNVNLIPTAQGGTHVNGLRTGLLEALREFCELHNLLPRQVKLSADDVWDGVCFILSLKWVEPQFSGQTKERLSSREAAATVQTLIKDGFSLWLNQNPDTARQFGNLACGIGVLIQP